MNEVAQAILLWHQNIERFLPWKDTNDPYLIWLSEIILQQTRVNQGLPYYIRFKEQFPTVKDLAEASEDEIFSLWQGLGYYSRARNLHASAKFIYYECQGIFPSTYSEILKLKGVGPYTAAAIASFAFGEHIAVLDGNVFRVISRIFNIDIDILLSQGKKVFQEMATQLLGSQSSASFNQAIMDFGALQCVPKNPSCHQCPVQDLCEAYKLDIVDKRPVKKKKAPRKRRYFHYFVLEQDSKVLLEKRSGNDIWKGLYQFPLGISDSSKMTEQPFGLNLSDKTLVHASKQILTHQEINSYFYEVEDFQIVDMSSYQWIAIKDLNQYGFPNTIVKYFKFRNWILE